MAITATWPNTLPGPSQESWKPQTTPRLKGGQMGDGYNVEAADGLNHMLRKFPGLEFGPLTPAQKLTMETFLKERGGYKAFFWKPPLESSNTKVKARTWTISKSGALFFVTVDMEEVANV